MANADGKLGTMLGLLDEPGWERFRTFLESPYFNRSKPVRALGLLFEKLIRENGATPTEIAIFSQVFPQESYDATKLKNLIAALQRKLDQFWAHEALELDGALQRRLVLHQLNQLNESHYFPKYHERAISFLAQAAVEEEYRQLTLFQVAESWEAAQIRLGDRSPGAAPTGAYHHAWQFFQLQTVKFLVRQANQGAIQETMDDAANAEAVLALGSHQAEALPALQLYRALLDVFRNPGEPEPFLHLRARLHALAPEVAAADASDVYTGAINHCIRRINSGKAEFAPVMLELYQEMDRLGVLLFHGRLPAAQFKNMVGLALRFRAFEWAQDIIHRYGGLLDQDPYGNASAFNQGMLHFALAEFAAAERCFNQVLQEFDDVFFGLDARSYLLRIHYETGNWTGLESLAESFKMYLKRNKRIPKAHRNSYLQTALFSARLARIPPWKPQVLQRLRTAIEKAQFAATSKQWLLQKVDARLAEGR